MGETIYKVMKKNGVWSLILGILTVTIGVTVGVGQIVVGASLLKRKSEITF